MKISLKFVAQGPINIPALVQIMAWRRLGDKPLSELMMAYLNDIYMRHSVSMIYEHSCAAGSHYNAVSVIISG